MASKNTQFSVAVHIMAGLAYNTDRTVTSADLAGSVNADPGFVRQVLSKLSKAGLVHTTVGKNGSSSLGKPADQISLFEIFEAVDAPDPFVIHSYKAQRACPVSCNIKSSLGKVLDTVRSSVEDSLGRVSLTQIVEDIAS